MTSRVSFFKGMLQDLRHRMWMIALSCLGSFLAMPVFYLLLQQNWNARILWAYENGVDFDIPAYKLENVITCFREGFAVTGGIVLVAGALIVAVFGFHYVFSKKRTDQYHSLPIKRRNLFLIHYVNGFLIWFVPMVISIFSSGLLAMFFLKDFASWCLVLAELAKFIVNAVIAFLLVYHVAIVAVMLSGNIINTLVNGTILSFSVLAVMTMYHGFACIYFDTYYSDVYEHILQRTIWASPIPSAIYQLFMGADNAYQWWVVVMNLVMIAALWAAGFILYLKRPSELAEQGMKIKPVQVVFKSVWTMLAGLVGWMFFELMGYGVGWSIFGLVLTGILCYGILDVIFQMEFKAFFAHKVQMAVTIVGTVAVGLIFAWDIFGYDTYLPQKEDIAEIGIVVNNYSNGISSYVYDGMWSEQNRLDAMNYTDKEYAYAFLEEAVYDRNLNRDAETDFYRSDIRSIAVQVRVTKENGRTYYRTYRMDSYDEAVMMPILASDSYLENNVLIPEDVLREVADESVFYGGMTRFTLEGFERIQDVTNQLFAVELMEAYNADMMEDSSVYFYQTGQVVCSISYRGYDKEGDRNYYLNLDIYDSMHRTNAVLEKYGYDSKISLPSAQNLLYLEIVVYSEGEETLEQVFGLEPWDGISHKDSYDTFTARFTDETEIEELLSVISYQSPYRSAVFSKVPYISGEVRLCCKTDGFYYVNLKKGALPEKFVDAFSAEAY